MILSSYENENRKTQEPISIHITSRRPLPSASLVTLPAIGSSTEPPHLSNTLQTQHVKTSLVSNSIWKHRGYPILGSALDLGPFPGLSVRCPRINLGCGRPAALNRKGEYHARIEASRTTILEGEYYERIETNRE